MTLAWRRWTRALRASVLLGIRSSPNWTSVPLFIVYTILKPVSAAFILVFMYRAIAGPSAVARVDNYLGFVVVGGAMWGVASQVLRVVSDGMADDRTRHKMLKYVYLAVPRFGLFVVGRALGEAVTAVVSVVIVLLVATPALHLNLDPLRIDWPLLVLAIVAGAVVCVGVSVATAACLLGLRDSYGYGELVAALLYIVAGAAFPVGVLPGPIQTVALVTPFTYWLELSRRALLGPGALSALPDSVSTPLLVLRLAATTLGAILVCGLVFRWADTRARRLGLIDRETNF